MGALRIRDTLLAQGTDKFIPNLSLDCVVFGFHENQLNVLLLKLPYEQHMALPGGYVLQEESLEDAANRVLKERTGLSGVFLQQFHTFSNPDRIKFNFPTESLLKGGFTKNDLEWLTSRFVTVGFYALVDYLRVVPSPDIFSESCSWKDLKDIGILMMDHNQILHSALETLRLHLNYQPIGLNLLPEKFTMPELQRLYETILGRKLDRRNFQRKIRSYNILSDLKERKTGVAHKAPFLYQFDPVNYDRALKEGLRGGW
jgi:8-oxo-dGTP diphosphatase